MWVSNWFVKGLLNCVCLKGLIRSAILVLFTAADNVERQVLAHENVKLTTTRATKHVSR